MVRVLPPCLKHRCERRPPDLPPSIAWILLVNHLAQLCPTAWDSEAQAWRSNQAELQTAMAIVRSMALKNEAQPPACPRYRGCGRSWRSTPCTRGRCIDPRDAQPRQANQRTVAHRPLGEMQFAGCTAGAAPAPQRVALSALGSTEGGRTRLGPYAGPLGAFCRR